WDKRFLCVCLSLSVVAQDLPSGPPGCTDGSCYPATGNLLVGRAANLTATSTCGLQHPENYCIVSHLMDEDKCFTCDSQRPYHPAWNKNSHQVENVIYLKDVRGELTWWQSVNGEESVSIRLNLEAEFHFTHLIMKFKTFRPAVMIIERSSNFGRSWKTYRYFAYNCTIVFPNIPFHAPHRVSDVICEERYSQIEPSSLGEVIYRVLDPSIDVKDPYSQEIQDLLRITNLRINFTKLHTLGDNMLDRGPDVLQKYYYAMYELVVRGSCFCYGHASECVPVPGVAPGEPGMVGECWPTVAPLGQTHSLLNLENHVSTLLDSVTRYTWWQIHGRCVCKHNTEGLNCERCRYFHHDLPWRPAELYNPHRCRACGCDPVGSLDGGVCDSYTDPDGGMIAGQCQCKQNVKGARCDRCKEGFFGLSQNDPQGCQPCNCDPRGIVMLGSPCDQISGDCSCKRYVTGRYCNQCVPEHWGLGNDIFGCRPCRCDFGGAYDNRCSTDDGQCQCRPHLLGRQCADVEPGYFCAPLDFYVYEAEDAASHSPDSIALPGRPRPKAEIDCVEHFNNQLRRHRRHRHVAAAQQQRAALRRIRQLQQTPDVKIVHRERIAGRMVTWTGPGFARVKDGAGLVFKIDNIPFAMEYDIMIRYEPESTEDWEAVVRITSLLLPSSPRCGNVLPTEQMYTVILPHQRRYVEMPRPFCFEPKNHYVVSIRFQRHRASHRYLTAYILVDSLVLIPKYTELPGFQGNHPAAKHRREEMVHYMCLESFRATPVPSLAEMCTKLICSISSILHNGALNCDCDPQGSLGAECQRIGGQCPCKPNVMGRRCDQCAPGSFGFGPHGCTCDCHSQGSLSLQCDPVTGQCPCTAGAMGRQCADCERGQWGFPSCRPCQCNGHAETCDSRTGACLGCRDHTAGHLCDRCEDGFFGNPVLGSGERCRPCPCPDIPGSGHFNGESCHVDHASSQVMCRCKQGYAGPRCDRCAAGYFGDLESWGGECRPCQCNGNADVQDPESCDPRTGRCLKCLYNTDGPSCSACKEGYYGNALLRDCRRCTCATAGTRPSHCDGRGCRCDRITGACLCRDNVVGHNCDQCASNYWNFGTDGGCKACDCHPQHSRRPRCNMFTGQCHCRPGFGGRNCSECQQLHWGDPQVRCYECGCDPLGSETQQCERLTGQCLCVEGATGRRCDQCARGFTGGFPKCVRCHPCFDTWDGAVRQLQQDLERIGRKVQDILKTGVVPGITDVRILDLERKLGAVRELLRSGDREGLFNLISQALDELRAEITLINGRLMVPAEELNGTMVMDEQLRRNLTRLEEELRDVNATLAKKRHQLENRFSAGFADQFDKVRKYYQEFQGAEQQCNASVYGPDSPVEHSRVTRRRVEDLLAERQDKFQRTVAAQKKSLAELEEKTQNMDQKVQNLSNKVCGGYGNPNDNGSCPDSPCGGAGCHDNQGRGQCGGEGCGGTLSTALNALKLAKDVTNNITAVSDELQMVAKKLQATEILTQDVKMQAKGTLEKAQMKKEFFENSNKELKDFIKKIRDFLTEEGADPESIEKVAQQVLNISFPVSSSEMAKVVQEIKDSIANLTHVDGIFNDTAVQLQRAKELLRNAQDAKTRAMAVKDISNQTRLAISDSENAIAAAEKALKKAHESLNSTRAMENKLSDMDNKLMEAMTQLANLSEGVEALQNKTEQNRDMALETKAIADNATQAADGLKQVEEVDKRYKELQDKIGAVNGGSGGMDGVQKRIEDIKKQAEDLLSKATKGIEDLQNLEKKFRMNEKKMQGQMDKLSSLEVQATSLRNDIREAVQRYSNC
uniref:Laminin, beta 2-like n=1 Tax=Scleropages formosus TaxID=113540 RepID=A0A8C9RWJ6_SCLFO